MRKTNNPHTSYNMPQNKNKSIKNVLNSYAIEDILDNFSNIEKQIENLIATSSEDFLNLNKRFKKFYNDVNHISEQSADVFKGITNNTQTAYVTELNQIADNYKDIYNSIEYQIHKCYAILKNISKNLNFINLNIRNFKQNLKTLKFLITNLKIVSITNENNKNITEIDNLIEHINSIYPCFDDSFNISNKVFTSSLQTIISLKEKLDYSNNVLQTFNSSINITGDKFNEALRIMPILNDNADKCSLGLSKIITNLQYQDIISQKISHVKKTHNTLIRKLQEHDKHPNTTSYLKNKAGLYVQISDISGLQAAQLIHANKEYQKALENIISQFTGIGEIIESISGICKDYFEHSNNEKKETFEVTINNLNLYQEFGKELQLINNLFELQIESLILKSESLIKCYSKIQDFNTTLDNFTNQVTKHSASSGAQRLSSKTIRQIVSISTELGKISKNLSAIKNDNEQLMKFLQKEFHEGYLKQNHEANIASQSAKAERAIEQITKTFKNSHNTIAETLDNSSQISAKVKLAIQEVKYYDLFESEIETIIKQLNELNRNLKIQDKDAFRELNEFDDLKQTYTMESEYAVHERFESDLQTNKDLNLFDDDLFDQKDISDDDDNLELF